MTLSKIAEIAKFFTSNALLLALDGPLVVLFGFMLYGIDVNITIIAASFLGVFSIYTLNKATDKREDSITPEVSRMPKSQAHHQWHHDGCQCDDPTENIVHGSCKSSFGSQWVHREKAPGKGQ